MDTKPTTVSEALYLIPPQYKAMENGDDRIFVNGDTCFGFGVNQLKNVHINDRTIEFSFDGALIIFFRNIECIQITIL